MLNEILAYAERTGLKTEQGFAAKPVKWLICCDQSGKFTAITSLENDKKSESFQSVQIWEVKLKEHFVIFWQRNSK